MVPIKLKIDLSAMIFEFEGSADFAREALAEFLSARPHKLKQSIEDAAEFEEADLQACDTESDDNGSNENKASGKTVRKKSPARIESYIILPNLDLVGKGHGRQSLKDLYAEKGGKTLNNNEASTLFVHYLTRVMSEENVSLNHIYSCYKHVGLRVPGSLRSLMYNQKKRGHFINIAKLDELKLTMNGENLIDHDLPRKEKATK